MSRERAIVDGDGEIPMFVSECSEPERTYPVVCATERLTAP